MRATCRVLSLCLLASLGPVRAGRAADGPAVAVYWEPPGRPPLGAEARAAFVETMQRQGARVIDAVATAPKASPLAPALEAAKDAYARFAFPDAIARLDELQRLADARGGGELGGRQLSEIFLYRGLARLETAGAEAAWDDLVRAARLDPARVLDPARFPPRAASAFSRAVAEATAVPRAQLVVDAPAGAVVRVDGESAAGGAVTLGPHFVSVTALGYEPWAGVVSVASAREHFPAPLRAYQAPEGDRLLALAGAPVPARLVLGALAIAPTGWRFTVSAVALPEGKVMTDSTPLREVPTRYAVQALVQAVAPGPAAAGTRARWTTWAVAGGVVVLVSVVTTLLLTRDTYNPNVSGNVGTLK